MQDLCEKLLDISDHRRDSASGERQRILTDQWLEDHIGIITNHHISLLQVATVIQCTLSTYNPAVCLTPTQAEVDRFYSTSLLLKDYYTGMEGTLSHTFVITSIIITIFLYHKYVTGCKNSY